MLHLKMPLPVLDFANAHAWRMSHHSASPSNRGVSEGLLCAERNPSSGVRSSARPLPLDFAEAGKAPKVTLRLTRWPVLGRIKVA